MQNTRNLEIISYALIVIGVICIPSLAEEPSMSVFTALFLGGGGLLFRETRKMKATGERYRKYIMMIVNNGRSSIDEISSALTIPFDTVIKDLQRMIDDEYFAGAYIDVHQHRIVMPGVDAFSPAYMSTPAAAVTTATAEPSNQYIASIINCISCGARNRLIPGRMVDCPYCGTALQ